MITTGQFIETHRETSNRADCLASLAMAASLVSEGSGLTCEKKRKNIVLSLLEVMHFLSEDLSARTVELSDTAEREEVQERISCNCNALNRRAVHPATPQGVLHERDTKQPNARRVV